MNERTVILLGRETAQSVQTSETHADRLESRGVADTVTVARYDQEYRVRDAAGRPVDEWGATAERRQFLVPMAVAETNEMQTALQTTAATIAGPSSVCEPVGRSSAVTQAILDRATARWEPSADTSLVLVGLGSSSLPHHQQTLDLHETRLRDGTDYGEVSTCYLLQDPAVECARYAVSNDRVVVVPVFICPSPATREQIPSKLDFEDSDVHYTEPLGTHPQITDALHAQVVRRAVLEDTGTDSEPTVAASQTG